MLNPSRPRLRGENGTVLMLMPVAVLIMFVLAAIILDNLSSGPDVSINQDGSVTVSLSKRVPHLFARALPGAPDDKLVLATATATVQQR